MLDFGWAELLFIMAIVVLVTGPQDIPKILYNLGKLFRRLQYIRFAMSRQFEEFMKAHDLEDLQRGVNFEAPDYDEAAADAGADTPDEALADEDGLTRISEEDGRGDEPEDWPRYE